ncbi:MAG: MBL fold metallo-hydrolase [Rickettsiales bacterium]|jgi:ribonuclease BN (tRNA processing enzyme)|nr:MBL fold metallo-hydrolase [Rickettsiales bacterium]
MRIEILGTGGGNTPELGNSSFLVWNDDMTEAVLMDCGYMTYPRLKELENRTGRKRDVIKAIKTVAISHLHSDHAGSLGALIAHCRYLIKTKIRVAGVDLSEYLKLTDSRASECVTGIDGRIKAIPTTHDLMPSCALYFDGLLYSGDSDKPLLALPEAKEAKVIIHEGRMDDIPSHTNIEDLAKSATAEIRAKTWIIHFSTNMAEAISARAKRLGFAGVCCQGQIIEV